MMTRSLGLFAVIFSSTVLVGPQSATAFEMRQIPDEYETASGTALALSNAGVASAEPHAAVRLNPALLSMDKKYTVSGGYHWPSAGREFFQASIVDAKTSPLAAGLSYTGYTDNYVYSNEKGRGDDPETILDSPVIRRGFVGFGQAFKDIAIGAGATYVEANPVMTSEAYENGDSRIKGVGLNVGLAGAFGPALRYGMSAENLTNKKISEYSPKTYRGGVSYALNPKIIVNLDYRQRERVLQFEALPATSLEENDKLMKNPEQLVIGSVAARLEDYLQLLGSYGQSTTDERRTYGAGVAVTGNNFTLSYMTTKPYMKRSANHQAVSLGVQVAM
jgi:hypothetical protein